MGSEWKVIQLNQFVKHRKGFAFKSKDYVSSGIPVVRVSNFTDDSIDISDFKYVRSDIADEKIAFELVENDVVIATVGSWPKNPASVVGKVIRVPITATPSLLNQNAVVLRPISGEKYDKDFLFYLLKNNDFSNYIISTAQGSANQASITLKDIYAYSFPLPNPEERKALSSILRELDNKITLNRQINQTLEQMAQTLFKSWFVDFDPVIDNALDVGFFEKDLAFSEELLRRVEARKAVRESGNFKPLSEDIRRLFPNAFEECAEPALGLGGWIPEGWDINCLENISKCIKGISYKSSELSASDTALVTLKSFQRGGGYRLDGLKSYVGSYKKEQEVVAGDLIIACTDVTQAADIIGKPAIVISDPCYSKLVVSLDVSVIRPKHISLKYYLYGIAKTSEFQNYTYSHSTGTTVLHLSKNAVPNFMVSLPNELILQRYHEMVLPLFDSIEKNTCSLRVLTQLRDTLLPKLISGELSLSDIKIDIPEETLI